MNLKETFNRAIPYMLIAVVFAILAAVSGYGYCSSAEGTTLALVEKLSTGAIPFVDEWLSTQAFAIFLVPFFTMWDSVTGGASGAIYFFRLIYILFVFVVALFFYKGFSKDLGTVFATAVSLCLLLCLGSNNEGFSCYNTCALCLVISCIFGACTWRRWRGDDGSTSGYARVLQPIACGAFAALAASCSLGILPLLIIAAVIASIFAIILRNPKIVFCVAWIAAGYAVVLIVFFIYLLGFVDPSQMAAAMFSAFVDNHGLLFSSGAVDAVSLPAIPAAIFITVCAFIAAVGIVRTTHMLRLVLRHEIAGAAILAAVTLLCFILGLAGHTIGSQEDITNGTFMSGQSELEALSSNVQDTEGVWIVSDNPAAYLATKGRCAAPTVATALLTEEDVQAFCDEGGHAYPEWIIVQEPTATADQSLQGYIYKLNSSLDKNEQYAPVSSNGYGTIYKRASKPSYISQK